MWGTLGKYILLASTTLGSMIFDSLNLILFSVSFSLYAFNVYKFPLYKINLYFIFYVVKDLLFYEYLYVYIFYCHIPESVWGLVNTS